MRLLVYITASLIFFSCNDAVLVESQKSFEQSQWLASDSIALHFTIEDTVTTYRLIADITHGDDFSFQNLYVNIFNVLPNGQSMTKALSYELSDGKGKWEGNCRWGKCRAEIVLQDKFYFPNPGNYVIGMHPYMRINPVEGIHTASLRIEEVLD